MFTIGIPSFFLALQPNKKRIEGHFMKNVLLKALPGGLENGEKILKKRFAEVEWRQYEDYLTVDSADAL